MSYVAYLRVSTKQQGASGLGLEAQQMQVRKFVGGAGEILREYVEVESGKRDDRPQLEKAIRHAKEAGARLLIAKLDRLSRNAAFIFKLRDSGVNFVCADMPEANSLTIGIMAVLAQDERERIAARTKAALEAKKAQGKILGTPANLTEKGRKRGLAVRQENARTDRANVQATELAVRYREDGLTLREIADKLEEIGMKTRYGKTFLPMSVKRLLDRYREDNALVAGEGQLQEAPGVNEDGHDDLVVT